MYNELTKNDIKKLEEEIEEVKVRYHAVKVGTLFSMSNIKTFEDENLDISETGEIVNIDGNGNRVSSTLYGHQKVYFLVGVNKVAPDFEAALWRARNVAAPKRAQSMGCRTPCAAKADRCYDCKSPERICRGLVVLWKPMMGMEAEVVLVDEDLGY